MTKKYAKPEIEFIELATDIIQTSGEQPPVKAQLYSGGFDMGNTTADSIKVQY